jgi:hypothetical protein
LWEGLQVKMEEVMEAVVEAVRRGRAPRQERAFPALRNGALI